MTNAAIPLTKMCRYPHTLCPAASAHRDPSGTTATTCTPAATAASASCTCSGDASSSSLRQMTMLRQLATTCAQSLDSVLRACNCPQQRQAGSDGQADNATCGGAAGCFTLHFKQLDCHARSSLCWCLSPPQSRRPQAAEHVLGRSAHLCCGSTKAGTPRTTSMGYSVYSAKWCASARWWLMKTWNLRVQRTTVGQIAHRTGVTAP